jgi:hypothetical protein
MSPTASTTLVPSSADGSQAFIVLDILADHQSVNRLAERILQYLHRLDIIGAEHLPLGGAGRGADRGGGRDKSVVRNLVHRYQFGLSDRGRSRAKDAAVLDPTAAAGREYRAAADRRLDVGQSKNALHPLAPPVRSSSVARGAVRGNV